MKRNKLIIIAAVFSPEPIVSANLLYDLANELSRYYEVTVLRPKPTRPLGFNFPKDTDCKHPFKMITLDSYTCPESKLIGRFRESLSMGFAAKRYIEEHHKEIDFIFNDAWHLFGINIIARTARKYGIKYITPVQDIYPESLFSKLPNVPAVKNIVKALLLPIDRYNLQNASRVHTISDKMVDILSETRNVSNDKFVVIRNWQDDRQFTDYLEKHPTSDKGSEEIVFMYLGNVGFLAGIEVLIDAMKLIPDADVRLVIAGAGAARNSLRERAKGDRRILFKDVPAGQVPAIQAEADIMVLPVKRGFALSSIPSKLPAYMFSAKPILASVDLESDTAACIRECDGGWVVEPESPELLAKQIKECLKMNRKELIEIGKRGREFAMTHLSREKNLSKLVAACREVIENQ